MNYLSASEYETYGLDSSTHAAWVAAASSLVDAYCRRPTLGVSQFTERIRVMQGRNSVQLTYLPLVVPDGATSPLNSARGRYAAPRRGDDPTMWDTTAEIAMVFGLPGTWVAIDVAAMDTFAETGEVSWLPNPLRLLFQELEITYTAGFAQIPDPIKFACAQIVRNAQATPALNVRSGVVDTMHLDYFADTLLDATVQTMLAPYLAQKVG
jgi:hypothetical protein